MNYDKTMYLLYSVLVLIIIFIVSLFSNYGKNISEEPGFNMYFGWFIGLLIFNLFNILVTLIYHYFMKDLIGPRGIIGEKGERGLAGKDALCFCAANGDTISEVTNNIDMEGEVRSYSVMSNNGNVVGSVITDDSAPSGTNLVVQPNE